MKRKGSAQQNVGGTVIGAPSKALVYYYFDDVFGNYCFS